MAPALFSAVVSAAILVGAAGLGSGVDTASAVGANCSPVQISSPAFVVETKSYARDLYREGDELYVAVAS